MNKKSASQEGEEVCGIVMPISEIDGCSAHHWVDVLQIISDSVTDVGFIPRLVSNADDVGVIQKRIIENLYDNPIVVCDVSCKNPNVMFELGMRLAFDKPTILIKDNHTPFSFDTSPIEHLTYPRDLHYPSIVEFKARLADKIKATYDSARADEGYTTFLKHFGQFTVAKLDKKEVPTQEYLLEELSFIRSSLTQLNRESVRRSPKENSGYELIHIHVAPPKELVRKVLDELKSWDLVADIHTMLGTDGTYVRARFATLSTYNRASKAVNDIVKAYYPEGNNL